MNAELMSANVGHELEFHDYLKAAALTVVLNEERELSGVCIEVILDATSLCAFLLRNTSTSARLDLDPVDAVHVGNFEVSENLRRDGLVVLGLRILNLLSEFSETFFSVLLDVGVDDGFGIVANLFGEGRRGLSDDRQRWGIDVEPAHQITLVRFENPIQDQKKRTS